MAGDNRLSAAIFGPKRLVTTGCQQPSPLNFAALVSGVQLLLKVHILPLTPLWKGFCQPGKKKEVNKKLFPFVKMVGKKQHGLLT